MDTDDLTEMAYESIIIANEITDFLRTGEINYAAESEP